MPSTLTFYLSRIIGNKVISDNGSFVGKVVDLIIDPSTSRPKLLAVNIKSGKETKTYNFDHFEIYKRRGQYKIKCKRLEEISLSKGKHIYLIKHIMDQQIVDMNGRKVVRVNDLRIARVVTGSYLIAVDVGLEGLLRRIGIAKPIQKILYVFNLNLPTKLILWDEVETVNLSRMDIQLQKPYSKLDTLHPSDLADIIEDLDHQTQVDIISSLDEEVAADVFEELEMDAQKKLLDRLSVAKAADVLEKMPSDEVADILEELEDDKVEELLLEMESEASQEVRELMEYSENHVGSLMSTEFVSFYETATIDEVLNNLRQTKPESNTIYSLFVTDDNEKLKAIISLRDLLISEPSVILKDIMQKKFVFAYDEDKINTLPELFSKYNLLALPVVDRDMNMMGTVVIDDVIDKLLE